MAVKTKVILFSELDKCWSADRFFDLCHGCSRVDRCAFPTARQGRIRNAEDFVNLCQLKAVEAQERLERIEAAP